MLNQNNLFFILGTAVLYLFFKCNEEEKFSQTGGSLLNIYDEPLEPCNEGNMGSGSWDSQGKCSELGGGIHQICFKNIDNPKLKFSQNTGQSDWSSNRNKNSNHCVCLGAWSLFVKKNKENKNKYGSPNKLNSNQFLKCSAIPKVSLSKDYVGKFKGWDKWNGLEINGQTKEGVEKLVNICHNQGNTNQKLNLKNNYCNFAKEIASLKNSDLYKNLGC